MWSRELNVQTIGLVHVHDGAEVAVAETGLRKVPVEHRGIEGLLIT